MLSSALFWPGLSDLSTISLISTVLASLPNLFTISLMSAGKVSNKLFHLLALHLSLTTLPLSWAPAVVKPHVGGCGTGATISVAATDGAAVAATDGAAVAAPDGADGADGPAPDGPAVAAPDGPAVAAPDGLADGPAVTDSDDGAAESAALACFFPAGPAAAAASAGLFFPFFLPALDGWAGSDDFSALVAWPGSVGCRPGVARSFAMLFRLFRS